MDLFEFCKITHVIRETIPEVKQADLWTVLLRGYKVGLLTRVEYLALGDWLYFNEHLFDRK